MANKEELLEAIGNMTVLELAEFVEAFKTNGSSSQVRCVKRSPDCRK
jgi:ribosomal protein L7/L12